MLLVATALAGPVHARFQENLTLVWAGIDYRALDLFVPEPFDDPTYKVTWGPGGGLFDFVGTFPTQRDAWVRLCTDWNQMYLLERIPQVKKQLRGRVVVDVPDQCAPSYEARAHFHLEAETGRKPPWMNDTHVADAVRTWPLKEVEGLAFIVIAERFSKPEDQACVWPTFFDVESRNVLATDRVCATPGGLAFRNYWFGPLAYATKGMLAQLAEGRL